MKDERENEDKKAVFLSTEKMKKKDAISDASGECFFLRRIVFFASSGLQPKTFTPALHTGTMAVKFASVGR